MNGEKPPLGIFGAGWVGLVTGACFAALGHDVVVRDVVTKRIDDLNAGRLPFHEPGLAELIERNRDRLTFTLDVSELKTGTDIFFACVDTPPTPSGDADLTYVWSVILTSAVATDANIAAAPNAATARMKCLILLPLLWLLGLW